MKCSIIDSIIKDISGLGCIDRWNYIESKRTLELSLRNLGVGYLYIQISEDRSSYTIFDGFAEIGSRPPYIQIHRDYVKDFRITEESLCEVISDLSKIVNDVEDGNLGDFLVNNFCTYQLSISRAGIIYKGNTNQEFIDLNITLPGYHNTILRLSEYFEVFIDRYIALYSTAEIISIFKGRESKVIGSTFPHPANIVKHEGDELWISSSTLNLGEVSLSKTNRNKIKQYLEKNIYYGCT